VRLPGAKEFRKALKCDTAALLDSVLDAAEARGLAVYAVGGPVRDLVLGKEINDVDLLVESGDAVALATLAAPPDARVTPHDRFGTVLSREFGVRRMPTSAHFRESSPAAWKKISHGATSRSTLWRCRSPTKRSASTRGSSTWRAVSPISPEGTSGSCIREVFTTIQRGCCAQRASDRASDCR